MKNGWNACAMSYSVSLGAPVEPTKNCAPLFTPHPTLTRTRNRAGQWATCPMCGTTTRAYYALAIALARIWARCASPTTTHLLPHPFSSSCITLDPGSIFAFNDVRTRWARFFCAGRVRASNPPPYTIPAPPSARGSATRRAPTTATSRFSLKTSTPTHPEFTNSSVVRAPGT